MNTDKYMDLFLQESREHLQDLNNELLKLEENPKNRESLNSVFRYLHTFKGMSATMGFENITKLNHQLENLLDELRKNQLSLSPEMIDLLFRSVDILGEMVEATAAGQDQLFDIDVLVGELDRYINLDEKIDREQIIPHSHIDLDLALEEKRLLNDAIEKGQNVFQVIIEIPPDCVMKSVRAFMVFNSLEKLGQILKSIPDSHDLEDEKFENEFTLVLITAENEQVISEAINRISEVSIKQFNLLSAFSNLPSTYPNNNTSGYSSSQINQTVRVDIGKLDKLMNLVGELVINKSRLEQIAKMTNDSALSETVIQINKITSDLQTITMGARMVPIEQVFNRFPRMVRDLNKELDKDIVLVMEGKETELDRKIIDEIADPLVHLVRNSIDHGIESAAERQKRGKPEKGTLKLIAKQEGNSIIIIVKDDGRGLNAEDIKRKALEKDIIPLQEIEQMDENSLLNLIFIPGFSTASEVTDLSGRGVGLDVVKATIQSLNGSINVESLLGESTTFTISLPLTLAIIQALMVTVGTEIYAIPLANIDEITATEKNEIKRVQGQKVIVLRGNVLRLISLAELLDVAEDENDHTDKFYVVVINRNNQNIGLIVNELIGLQEIVISSLGRLLHGTRGISGAAVLGDGNISLIIDISTLF